MFVATNRIKITSGHGQELEERFKRQGGVEQQPGFLGFELWRQNGDAEHEEYLVVTHWESKEAHDGWTHSDAFRAAHAGQRPEFIVGGEFHTYEVRISSSPQGSKA